MVSSFYGGLRTSGAVIEPNANTGGLLLEPPSGVLGKTEDLIFSQLRTFFNMPIEQPQTHQPYTLYPSKIFCYLSMSCSSAGGFDN